MSYGPLETRFWRHVNKTAGCWLWTGTTGRWGYGLTVITTIPKRVRTSAHRAAWMITFGDIIEGLCVLHRCDNTACVRPDHLFLGTNADNTADMIAKGRAVNLKGDDCPYAKITSKEVALIRSEYVPRKVSTRKLARRYGISPSQISRIVRGERWVEENSCPQL